MDTVSNEALFAGLGVLATILGIGLAWFAGRRSERAAADQNRIAAHSVALEWKRDLRTWGNEAIDVLAAGSYACKSHDERDVDCLERVYEIRTRLSALIDRGRFFLPNLPAENIGSDHPAAYQGWRHPALDPLVAAERVLGDKGIGNHPTREAALISMRREFVSSVQRILGPQDQNTEIRRMIAAGTASKTHDDTLGGLLPDPKTIPTGAERLLWSTAPKQRR